MFRPIQSVIILVIKKIGLPLCGRPILLSLVWLQTELDSTQSYYHYNHSDHITLIKHHWFSPLLVSIIKPIFYTLILSKKPRLVLFFFCHFLHSLRTVVGFFITFHDFMGGGLLSRGTCIGSHRFLSKEKWHCVDAANRDNAWLYFNLFNEHLSRFTPKLDIIILYKWPCQIKPFCCRHLFSIFLVDKKCENLKG